MDRPFFPRLAAATGAAVIAAASLAACSPEATEQSPEQSAESAADGTSISPADVKTLVDAGEDFALVDVRTAEEYAEGYIQGAINLPYDSITAESAAAAIDSLDEQVVLYCHSGRRAGIAADTLASLGYTNVVNMGGISGWTWGLVTDK